MISPYQILDDIILERTRQDRKWGEQNHPDGTNDEMYARGSANTAKAVTDRAAQDDRLTWRMILNEEVQEAFAEVDPQKLRTELIQVAAVAVAWIEAIDRRPDA